MRDLVTGVLGVLISIMLMSQGAPAQSPEAVPRNVRVIVEYIETSHEILTALMTSEHADSGPALHARMRELTREGKAKVMETSIVTCRAGQKATAESILEYIYPTEYDVDRYRWMTEEQREALMESDAARIHFRPPYFQAFETRNLGVTLETEPVIGSNGSIVDLRFAPEIVGLLRLLTYIEHEDQWGKASWKMPVMQSLRSNTSMILMDRKFSLIGVLTPNKIDGGTDTTRKILLFVRADIMPAGS